MTSMDEATEKVNPQTIGEWFSKFFLRGKTVGLYFMMILSAFASIVLFVHRVDMYTFLAAFAMTLAGWLVTTDLIAHLWYDGFDSGITFDEFLKKFASGRTHDVYGMAVFSAGMAASYFLGSIQALTLAATEIGLLIVFALLLKTKFYH